MARYAGGGGDWVALLLIHQVAMRSLAMGAGSGAVSREEARWVERDRRGYEGARVR